MVAVAGAFVVRLDEHALTSRILSWLRGTALINEQVIPSVHRKKALRLVAGVDLNDAPYVALALYFDCPIWTGDKKLREGLAAADFKKTLSTVEVRRLIEEG